MTAPADSGLAAMLAIIGGLGLLVGLAVYVWYAFALSRLFPRIDGEGWKGWVPVLNEAEILARGGVPAWSVVFYFIPIVQLYGLYLKVVATHRINRRFGRSAGMTVLAILLPPVWATVLAWGPAPYPEGDRLAALQPGPRRSAPPPAAPARDASGYTIPSLAPAGTGSSETPSLIFPDYAAPPAGAATPTPPPAATPTAGVPQGEPAAPRSFAPPSFAPPAPSPSTPSPSFAPPAPPAPSPAAASVPPAASIPPAAPVPTAAPVPPAAPVLPPAAAPTPPPPTAQPTPSAPAQPTTGIMAAMGDVPPAASQPGPAPAPADPLPDEEPAAAAPAPEANRVVRPVPPSFRDGAPSDAPQMPTIRPVPSVTAAAPAGEQSTPAPAAATPAAAAAPGGLVPDVDKTVVTPRPTDDDLDATVVVARKRGVRRVLVLDDGRRFSLSGASVVIGRNPTGEPGEQRLAIPDTTRTLSKTHARLVVQEDEWRLTDLHATNGVVVVADDGSETLLDAGESVVGTGRFILGEVGMHVVAERDS
ncbi:DUF5684 domain-containing protein [Microbacterium sp. CH1]|uniref:DUF5684 domain-containing protein n=1 Tax=Microbacterium sp. CH1 TaxID=1770208 RepID=UPI0007893085|nr:DUF5684 domain-containing protein [Microbacterium sp. CH1]KYJ98022.1 hypothetical protein AUV07_12040 [Microbacterium sp. CH1]